MGVESFPRPSDKPQEGQKIEGKKNVEDEALAAKAEDVINAAVNFKTIERALSQLSRSKSEGDVEGEKSVVVSKHAEAFGSLENNLPHGGLYGIRGLSPAIEKLKSAGKPKEIIKQAADILPVAEATADVFDLARNTLSVKRSLASELPPERKSGAVAEKARDLMAARHKFAAIATYANSLISGVESLTRHSGQDAVERDKKVILDYYRQGYDLIEKGLPVEVVTSSDRIHSIRGFSDAIEKLRKAEKPKDIKAAATDILAIAGTVVDAFEVINKSFFEAEIAAKQSGGE